MMPPYTFPATRKISLFNQSASCSLLSIPPFLFCRTEADAMEEVVIVGGGIAGLATALGLHRKGIRSVILESSESLRASGYALTIWTNAWRALDALGVADSLRQTHLRLQRIVVNSVSTGTTTTQLLISAQKNEGETEMRCLQRSLLLEELAKELPPGTIRYSSKVAAIEEDGYLKVLHLVDGSTIKAKVLLGCDGVNSVVSRWLGLSKPYFSSRSAIRGFAAFPEGHGIKPQFLQLFGEGYRAGMMPCDEQNVYWFFTWSPSDQEKEAEHNPSEMVKLVLSKIMKSKLTEQIIEVIEKSELSSVISSPLRYRWPFNLLWGNISKGNAAVAGDALHPMTPDLGQGGCSALEDAVVLTRCLGEALLPGKPNGTEEEEHKRIQKGLEKYAKERRWRSFQLIATAYLIGYIQQGEGVVKSFLRDRCLSGIMARMLLQKSDFDCGKI